MAREQANGIARRIVDNYNCWIMVLVGKVARHKANHNSCCHEEDEALVFAERPVNYIRQAALHPTGKYVGTAKGGGDSSSILLATVLEPDYDGLREVALLSSAGETGS